MTIQKMLFHGKTVKDALLTAKSTFQVDESQLQIKVLDEGKRNFLGIVQRPAIIEVTLPESDFDQTLESENSKPDLDGTCEIKNGQLHVSDPKGNGKAAIIIPTKQVVVAVNQTIVTKPTPILEKDIVGIEPIEEVIPAQVKVKISEDALTAYIEVTPEIIRSTELIDQSSQHRLELVTKSIEKSSKIITPDEIKDSLKAKGIIFGIDNEAILKAAEQANGSCVPVAKGQPPKQGKDGFIEYLFDSEPIEIIYDEDERVDYWERYTFFSVKEGDVIAKLHPAVPGTHGMKVTGKAISPDPVLSETLRVKDGVRISENGLEAIATIAGRPILEGQDKPHLTVTQLMIHPDDVDMASGNLRFWGDLLIKGNVTEGMQVSALGDITVEGNMMGSSIHAGGKVICKKNVIKSHISAGSPREIEDRLIPLVKNIEKLIMEIVQETGIVQQRLVKAGKLNNKSELHKGKESMGKIVSIIARKKEKAFKALMKEWDDVLNSIELPFPPEVDKLIENVSALANINNQTSSYNLEELEEILDEKQRIEQILDSLLKKQGDIICGYAQNCTLKAVGNITIASKGCYYSTLSSEKDVLVHGIFRGGEIFANGNVFVHETGTPGLSSGNVKIKVKDKSVVKIRKAFPETMIQVGNRFYTVKTEQRVLKLNLDENGNIVPGAFSD